MGLSRTTLLAITFLVSSCCVICKDDGPTYLMDQDFKDFILFPTGSYWIYATDNGEKDSIHLYQQEIGINDSQKIYPFNFEGFNQNLSSSFFQDTLFGGGGPDVAYDTVFHKDITVYYSYTERYTSNFLVTGLQFFNNKQPGTILDYSEDSKLKYIGELESYYVEGVQYSNVRIFETLIIADANLPQKIYYSKGIGVIKKELYNGQVWNLKRYFINN